MNDKESSIKVYFTLLKDCPPLEGTQSSMGGELKKIGDVSLAKAFIKYGDAESDQQAQLSSTQIQSMVPATEEEAWAKAQIIPMTFIQPINQP
ncbi:MAG: hypothetical protein AAB557_06470 [Patescibacteria group bacterium]